jgi:integrase
VFTEIAQTTNTKACHSPPRPCSTYATLRAALNLAVREGVLEANPARHIEITGYRKPHAQVWTDGRVEQWRRTGQRPAVGVWTAEHLATFLAAVAEDSLFALWWLIRLRGLRRGEAFGLRWAEVDLDHGLLFIVRNEFPSRRRVVVCPQLLRTSWSTLHAGESVHALRQRFEEHPLHIDKAEIVAILRSRGLHARADSVDRTLPPTIDTCKNGSLLRMLDIDVTTVFPAGQARPPGRATPNEPGLIGR